MRGRILLSLILILITGLATTGYALATPSSGFNEKDGDVFDDWEISRTRSFGEDGFYQITETTFRPVIAFESLGGDAALAYNLGNFLRRLGLPRSIKHWSLRTLREKFIKIGAKVVSHSRYITFQMAEVAVSRNLFHDILRRVRSLLLVAIPSGAG